MQFKSLRNNHSRALSLVRFLLPSLHFFLLLCNALAETKSRLREKIQMIAKRRRKKRRTPIPRLRSNGANASRLTDTARSRRA